MRSPCFSTASSSLQSHVLVLASSCKQPTIWTMLLRCQTDILVSRIASKDPVEPDCRNALHLPTASIQEARNLPPLLPNHSPRLSLTWTFSHLDLLSPGPSLTWTFSHLNDNMSISKLSLDLMRRERSMELILSTFREERLSPGKTF
jgi:hypothetical protein